jgi:hypothetical protein
MATSTDGSRKRKASQENEARSGKRAKIADPAPIVLDEFETEAQREVEANAGLTGAEVTAGQKISLSHQVGPINLFFYVAVFEISCPSGATSSSYSPRL